LATLAIVIPDTSPGIPLWSNLGFETNYKTWITSFQ